MENSNITAFQNVIADFAKVNKISRAKLEAYTAAIVASILKSKSKKTSGRIGRPVLDKTRAIHAAIIEAVNNGRQGQRDAVTVRRVVSVDYPQLDKITFNNALSALVKQGKIYHAGTAKTGTRGRQPFILSVNKSGGI